jgi:hypothetical protein
MGTPRLRAVVIALGVTLVIVGVATPAFRSNRPASYTGYEWLTVLQTVSWFTVGVLLLAFGIFAHTPTRDPLTRTDVLSTPLTPDEAVRRIADYVSEASGTEIRSAGSAVTAQLGSQLALRLMGVVTQYGVDRIPYRLDAVASPVPGGSEVTVTCRSDQGWYLIARSKVMDRAYRARFDYVVATLSAALNDGRR